MKKCYFCGITKGLKQIWLEDDMELQMPWQDTKYRACCMNCFNDPDNGMEDSPIPSSDWYSTDYHWKAKRLSIKVEAE